MHRSPSHPIPSHPKKGGVKGRRASDSSARRPFLLLSPLFLFYRTTNDHCIVFFFLKSYFCLRIFPVLCESHSNSTTRGLCAALARYFNVEIILRQSFVVFFNDTKKRKGDFFNFLSLFLTAVAAPTFVAAPYEAPRRRALPPPPQRAPSSSPPALKPSCPSSWAPPARGPKETPQPLPMEGRSPSSATRAPPRSRQRAPSSSPRSPRPPSPGSAATLP